MLLVGTKLSLVMVAALIVVLGQKVAKEPDGLLPGVLGVGVVTVHLCQQTLPSAVNGVAAAAALSETVLCVHEME